MMNLAKVFVPLFFAVAPVLATAQGFYLGPPNPTSADQLRLFADEKTGFADALFNGTNPYRVSMKNNHITITWSDKLKFQENTTGFLFGARYIDIARLPAGQYTWSVEVENGANIPLDGSASKGQPLMVTDARALKPAPFALQDISGHWWNYTDPGTGVFFSHDEKDNVLGAWLTYDKNGVPKWYVFQPKWETWSHTEYSDLYETSRSPNTASPATGITSLKSVGKARFVLQDSKGWGQSPDNLPNGSMLGQRFAFFYQFTGEALKQIEMRRFTEVTRRLP